MDSRTSQIALVTGGSNGIGKAIANRLATENIRVIVADIVPPSQEQENIIFRLCDVRKGEDVDALFAWMAAETGSPDILVLNAGQGIHEKLAEGDPEKWLNIINLNIMGVLRCIRAFVPPMQQKKRGDVVFISSVAATQPYEYGGVYSATKAAVEMIAETLRLETLPDLRTTIISAGITATVFFENRATQNSSIEEIGMGSLTADDIATDVWHALCKRRGTAVNKIITRPLAQRF